MSVARAKAKAKDKDGEQTALEKKQLFGKEIGTLQATMFTMEQQCMMLEQAATQVETASTMKAGQQAMAAQQAMTGGVSPKEVAAGGRPAAGGGKAAQLIAAAAKKFQARAFDPILRRFGWDRFDRGFWGQLDVALVQSPTSVAAMSGSCGVVEAEIQKFAQQMLANMGQTDPATGACVHRDSHRVPGRR